MRTLILVRHSLPEIDPDRAPGQWGLTAEGRARCIPLARRLAAHRPQVVVTSREAKAAQTGERVAGHLGIPCLAAAGLHEHCRLAGGWLDAGEFRTRIETFFARPDQLVFGLETAQQALDRFSAALGTVMAERPEAVVTVVSHGTVMALYYGAITGQNSFDFWQRLGIPGFYTVLWPDLVVYSQTLKIATLE
jgi:broad specificity phosphatase PhoE